MITELEAINQRRSIRKYKNIPIDNQLIESLNNKVKEVNQEGDLHIHVYVNHLLGLPLLLCYLMIQ